MSTRRGVLGLTVVTALLFADAASAATVRLSPFLREVPQPRIPATFDVLLDEVPDGSLDATIELHFFSPREVAQLSAAATGNPFLFPVATSDVRCSDLVVVCALFGGNSLGQVVPGPTIKLGELTFANQSAAGGVIDIIVAATSRYTHPVNGAVVLNEGAVVGALRVPEPAASVLLALGAVLSSLLRRRLDGTGQVP